MAIPGDLREVDGVFVVAFGAGCGQQAADEVVTNVCADGSSVFSIDASILLSRVESAVGVSSSVVEPQRR